MTLFIVLHVLICVFLVIVILLQPGKGDAGGGIGFGSSSSQSIFGSRGAGNFLTKTTSACAFLFLATSFFLTRSQISSQQGLRLESIPTAPTIPKPASPVQPGKTGEELKVDSKGNEKSSASGTKTSPVKAEEQKK